MLPESIKTYLETELNFNNLSVKRASGGSINRAVKLMCSSGSYFLKWNHSAPDNFFEIEARGLKLLAGAESNIYIPEVIAYSSPKNSRPGFLLMELIEEGSGSQSDSFNFGCELAHLHNNHSDMFGLDHDNYIGSLPQCNNQQKEWITFFVEERINPQLRMALDTGKIDQAVIKNWETLVSKLESIFPPAKPSLLHGDLWSGNYMFNRNGEAVLIDPAVYYGHPEMDLSFSKMFGGFSGSFYEGYESVNPLEANFSKRVDFYNLYPLLVHVNLFGGHYTSSLKQTLKQF